jgi:hypothetical protein
MRHRDKNRLGATAVATLTDEATGRILVKVKGGYPRTVYKKFKRAHREYIRRHRPQLLHKGRKP